MSRKWRAQTQCWGGVGWLSHYSDAFELVLSRACLIAAPVPHHPPPLPLADYLAVLSHHGPRLWELRSHKRWVRERFRSWRAYQRSELGFWRRVCHGLPQDGTTGMEAVTTVAYGDASIGQPGRGGGGPSRSMRGPCEAVFGKRHVVGVDEFLTSQRCHLCTEQLRTVVDMRPGHWLRHATQPTHTSPSRRPRKGDVVWGLKCVRG